MADLAARKADLRRRMRAARGALPDDERARLGSEIERRLLDVPEIRAAATVLLFYAFGSEVPTRGMASTLSARGIRVLLPYLVEGTMAAAAYEPGRPEALTPSGYGPKEPADRRAVDPGEVDVVVAPGLAFDREGHRLGYGGGHYDRYLASLRTDATRVGIGFGLQVVDAVPHGPDDQALHVVVTDRETIRVR